MKPSEIIAAMMGGLVGFAIVLASGVATPAKPLPECLPIQAMAEIIQEIPSAHFRRVTDDKVDLALRIYRRGTGNDRPWTLVYLADQPDHDGGIMMVGADEQICRWVIIPESNWRQIISLLEGDPS